MKRSWIRYYIAYKQNGLLLFLQRNLLKLIGTVILFVLILFAFQYQFPNITEQLSLFIEFQPHSLIYSIFFISESFLGILPPDLFILWTKNLAHPIAAISSLAALSYAGGIVSFQIGRKMRHLSFIENWLIRRLSEKSKYIQDWGAAVLVIAALFPLPFSPVCMAAGTIGYSTKPFLIFTSFRFLRFYVYALLLFQLF